MAKVVPYPKTIAGTHGCFVDGGINSTVWQFTTGYLPDQQQIQPGKIPDNCYDHNCQYHSHYKNTNIIHTLPPSAAVAGRHPAVAEVPAVERPALLGTLDKNARELRQLTLFHCDTEVL